jgi:hypothetical protein
MQPVSQLRQRSPRPRQRFTPPPPPPEGPPVCVFGLFFVSRVAPPPPPPARPARHHHHQPPERLPQLRPPPSPHARPGGRLCRTTGLACGPLIPNYFPLNRGQSRTMIHRSAPRACQRQNQDKTAAQQSSRAGNGEENEGHKRLRRLPISFLFPWSSDMDTA